MKLTKRWSILLATAIVAIQNKLMAQDGELLDIDVSIGEPEWYENPYVWIGIVIVVLLLVVVFRKRS